MSVVLSILGNSKCEMLSCLDLKKMHTTVYALLRKVRNIAVYSLYFGSPIYRYEALPIGIASAPQIWMDYVTLILNDFDQNLDTLLLWMTF